jgi:hypothetical protein
MSIVSTADVRARRLESSSFAVATLVELRQSPADAIETYVIDSGRIRRQFDLSDHEVSRTRVVLKGQASKASRARVEARTACGQGQPSDDFALTRTTRD